MFLERIYLFHWNIEISFVKQQFLFSNSKLCIILLQNSITKLLKLFDNSHNLWYISLH
jgi:hypothetical protein